MNGKVILEWKFYPPDVLEVEITEEGAGYQLVIDNGKAVATIDLEIFDANSQIRSELHTRIYKRLQAAQLIKHKRVELEDSRMIRIDPNGRITQFLEMKSPLILGTVNQGDVIVRNADGIIIVDTKQDRLDEMDSLHSLLMKHSGDLILERLLGSLTASYNDPPNALVHLYEIRDVLSKVIGNQTEMKRQVGITNGQNKRFGDLCCNLPLREGRHRGRALGELRSATDAELKEARDIANAMIVGYAQYLSSQTQIPES